MTSASDIPERHASPAFLTTRWSVVMSAREKDPEQAAAALEALCRTYWYPLYAYVRRFGRSAPDAQDLTQEFFARLLEKDYLRAADRTKGRFRTFLLVALKRFLANQWDRAHAESAAVAACRCRSIRLLRRVGMRWIPRRRSRRIGNTNTAGQ